jgi:GNAT superfamily N-acetyltransferase
MGMSVTQFQNAHLEAIARIRNKTFAEIDLNQFIWQPCQQVESLEMECLKHVYHDGAVRGYGAAYRLDETHFRLNLIVDPDYRHQGIGTLLLSHLEAETKRIEGRYLQARMLETMESSLRFARDRGFTEIHRMRGMSLSKIDFSYKKWEELGKKLSAKDFRVTTLKEELETNNNPIQKLARLHRASQQGWPSPDPTWEHNSPIESLESRFANVEFPDRFTIMKLNEDYVGYTSAKNKTAATAVHANYRSLGIATYMKAVDLKRCIDAGEEYFESASANPAMHRVNERLGYKFNGLCEVRFVKGE